MNIFKALSEGNGRISETNLTSFFNYLLDSSNDLGESLSFLFFNLINKVHDIESIFDILEIENGSIRRQLFQFSSQYEIMAEPEYIISNGDGSIQIPDIVLRVKDSNLEDKLYLIIENKIKVSAINKTQLEKQYKYIKDSEDFSDDVPIFNILITPDDENYAVMYEVGKKYNPSTVWLRWYSEQSDNTIAGIIQNLLELESGAQFPPIGNDVRFTLKSFVDYLVMLFSSRINNRRHSDFKGFNVVSEAMIDFEEELIILKRYSNNMIRIFDKDDELKKIDVKPVLRQLISDKSLNINLCTNSGNVKNTQILGREVIDLLKEY